VRRDLGELLAAIHPAFLRFPGGCFVEGGDLANRFQWKNTIGPLEDRKSHTNVWNYESLNGFGFHEYLQLAENLGAKPLFVVNVGISHSDLVPYNNIDSYVQDAVDALEYANGDTTTTYGKMRARNGHPAPFNLKMIEIGNENNQFDVSYRSSDYSKRFKQFKNAILAKYPGTEVIGDVDMWCADDCRQSWYQNNTENCTADYLDEHYYHNPGWFAQRFNKYDNYDRSQKIFCGEYASTSDCGNGNLNAALGEAIFRMGMENNGDVVRMSCFAPTFRNVNADNNWNYDMIHFNSNGYYCSPSYYTQMLCGANTGEVTVANAISGSVEKTVSNKYVGLGSWVTTVEFDDLQVVDNDGSSLIDDPMDVNKGWNYTKGTWNVSSGTLKQTDESVEGATAIYPTKVPSDNYTMTVKAKKNSGREGFLIILNYKDAQNYTWLNLGGWGNGQHAIEQCVGGAKTTLVSKSGSLTTGKWYNIKIEVNGSAVKCYLDNALLFATTLSGDNQVFGNATYSPDNKILYVKVVNPTNGTAKFNLQVKGSLSVSDPVLTVLSSSSSDDENTMANPKKVYPQQKTATVQDGVVSFNLQPYSLNILQLNTGVSTSINDVDNDAPQNFLHCSQEGIYNIDGIRLNCCEADLPHGFYIVDGKKIIK
jgi:alpha-L-arabinofuranosidase